MPEKTKILIADDEPSLRMVLETVLGKAGYKVDSVDNGAEALKMALNEDYGAALLDIRMPKMNGLQAFDEIHKQKPDLPVILMTAYSTAEIAVEAMKRGVFDYVIKPFSVEEVKILIARAIHLLNLNREVEYLTQEVQALSQEPTGPCRLIGESLKMQEVYKSIGKVANSKATVLLSGSTGTGKGMVAKTIHFVSDRWQKPFIQVNCGAIPEGLLESDLFGHEKGSFTGAINQKLGKFELAEGGTIFLDEIGEMNLNLQVKLLRVLQEHEYERVGGTQTYVADVRVIAATNRDLEKEIVEKRFREDLYYRLNVVSIYLPPLCERGDDVILLAQYFLNQFALEAQRVGVVFSPEVIDIFRHYLWPGNVRELGNAVEHALIMSNSKVIMPENLPPHFMSEETEISPKESSEAFHPLRSVLADAEKNHIIKALNCTGGNRAHAAKLLEISRRALIYKIQEHKLNN
ncbi:sigma-54 dependent transcriptional regulator [Desulfitobacterium sp.]|uniref:sigma-54-dependent transcriptional regulator n=1 Tax=Desulfitobacterium sp. TaxID=49981 RepID=UPI002B9CF060|nr:sigma-54 dependent transcriptional regulator [Desulfitobacterium sp.]HVJ48329.1 sigma-54 dependent transcriptional regulator [Desulfitobacterium sp.]